MGFRLLGDVARRRGDLGQALGHFRVAAIRAPEDYWNLHDIAVALRDLGQFDAAQESARRLAEKRPDLPMGSRLLGDLARRRGDARAAVAHFRDAAARAPGDVWNLHELAVTLCDLGEVDEAAEIARAVADKAPTLAMGPRLLGELARRRGDGLEALAQFRAAAARAPDDIWNLHDLVVTLRDLGQADEAQEAARAIAVKRPDMAMGFQLMGDLALRRGDARQALEHARVAAALEPEDIWRRVDVAAALRALRRFDEAETYAEAFVASRPEAAVAWTTLAECVRPTRPPRDVVALLEQGVLRAADPLVARQALAGEYLAAWRLEEAARLYDDVLAAEPRNGSAIFGKAQLARRRGDRAKCLDALAAATDIEPDNEWFVVDYARALVDAGRDAEAEALLAALIERNPVRPHALIFRGQAARERGDNDAARRFFEAAASLPIDNEDAIVELALEAFRAGRYDDARRRLNTLLARQPDNARALDALADVEQGVYDAETALQLRRAAVRLDKSQIWRRLSLAGLEAATGETAAAERTLADCEAWFGPQPEIALTRVHIERATGETAAAWRRLGEARRRFPAHFETWFQFVLMTIADGRFAEAAREIEAPPPHSRAEQARVLFARAELAAAQWRLDAAAADFAAAIAIAPADGWLHDRAAKNALLRLDIAAVEERLEVATRNDPGHRLLHGGAWKPSQTHVGQILDEYRLDAGALARLRAAAGAADAVAALQDLVREKPDYTPAAIALLVALRRNGALARRAAPRGGEAPIPRRISQYWDSGIPPDIERLCEEWRTRNPDFAYRRYTSATARRRLEEIGPPGAREAFDRAVEPAMKADLLRLALLHNEGGFYIDADDRGLQRLADIDPGDCDLVLYQEDFGTVGNNFIGAVPRHPVISAALQAAMEAILRGDSDLLWLATGPGLLTRRLAGYLAGGGRSDRLRVFDRHELHRAIAMHCASSYKQAGRHWVQQYFGRRRSGELRVAAAQ